MNFIKNILNRKKKKEEPSIVPEFETKKIFKGLFFSIGTTNNDLYFISIPVEARTAEGYSYGDTRHFKITEQEYFAIQENEELGIQLAQRCREREEDDRLFEKVGWPEWGS